MIRIFWNRNRIVVSKITTFRNILSVTTRILNDILVATGIIEV